MSNASRLAGWSSEPQCSRGHAGKQYPVWVIEVAADSQQLHSVRPDGFTEDFEKHFGSVRTLDNDVRLRRMKIYIAYQIFVCGANVVMINNNLGENCFGKRFP